MVVHHLVLFQFKPDLGQEKVEEVYNAFLKLKTSCVTAQTKETYIKELTGGKNSSPEGLTKVGDWSAVMLHLPRLKLRRRNEQQGLTHGFTAVFASEQERDFYVEKDPAHLEFKAWVVAFLEKAVVVDYTPGVL